MRPSTRRRRGPALNLPAFQLLPYHGPGMPPIDHAPVSSPAQPIGRAVRFGLPALAGILILALGSAYFLQKDRYLQATHRADVQAATRAAALAIAHHLDQTRLASATLAALLPGKGAAELGNVVGSSHVIFGGIDTLEVLTADGSPHWRFAARSPAVAEARLWPAAPGPLAVGEPEFRHEQGQLRFAQALHVAGRYVGETAAGISSSRLAPAMAALNKLNAQHALYVSTPRIAEPMLVDGVRLKPEVAAIQVGDPSYGLWLAAEPATPHSGSPFVLVELALCALAAALSGAFGVMVLSRPLARAAQSDTGAVGPDTATLDLIATTLDLAPAPASLQDSNGRYLTVNGAFERLTGHDRTTLRRWGEVAAQPGDLFEILAKATLPATAEIIAADGRRHTLSISRTVFGAENPGLDGCRLTILGDRSEHEEAARRVAQVTRSFAVYSGINAAIVRFTEQKPLLERCCELLVERGEFPLAFAWRRQDAGLSVIAACGEEPELAQAIVGKLPRCPAECEAYQSEIIICEDAHCRNQAMLSAMTPPGIRCLALLPLGAHREIGIGLASREARAFSADETELLRELTATLGHALATLSMNSARREAEERLRLSARVFENSSEGIFITDAENRILMVNRTFTQVTGYGAEEVIGRNPKLLSSGQQSPDFYRTMWESIQRRNEWHGEVQNRRKNGEYYSEWLTISVVRNELNEIVNYVAVFSDITSKKLIAERLNFLANYDTLTALPNRVLFTDRLERAIAAARQSRRRAATLALDLDRFSLVNETFGHAAGDQLLKEIARRLCAAVREGDSVSRVGGDEFSIVLADMESADEATVVAGKIMQSLATPLIHDGQEIFASASIGISVFPEDGDTVDALVRNANSAMYRAMEEGRNTFRFYHQQMNARSSERMSLQSDLRRALERGELVMHYQPFIDSRNGRIVGAEALLRWFRPGIGFLSPSAFIPLLEETGQIIPVGEWVLASALEDCQRWQAQGHRELFVAVNFSALQLHDKNVTRHLADTLSRLDANPRHLEIELTESAIMRDPERGIGVLNAFREIGARLSIDDFGTGYSSLAYIKKLPIDTLKIDRSFVIDTPSENEANSIVQAIIAMGHNLGLKVIAEGVQEKSQVDFLRQTRCDLLQGFYFSAALPQQAFLSLAGDDTAGDSLWRREPWQETPPVRLSRA